MNLEVEEQIARGVLIGVLARHPDIERASARMLVGYGDRLQRRVASGLDLSINDTALRRATRAALMHELEAIGWAFDPGGYDVWDIRLAAVLRSELTAHELASALRRGR